MKKLIISGGRIVIWGIGILGVATLMCVVSLFFSQILLSVSSYPDRIIVIPSFMTENGFWKTAIPIAIGGLGIAIVVDVIDKRLKKKRGG